MSELPLYQELIIWIILGSTMACFVLPLCGLAWQKWTNPIPPVPQFPGSSFPHIFAYFYTAFFVLTFAMASIQDVKLPDELLSPTEMVENIVLQIALYTPFLIAYFVLPRRELPHSSLWRKMSWVLAALCTIWIASGLLEACQFNKWLAETTQCPPVQNVVQRMLNGSNFERGLMAFMAIIVAPVTEECCFRGFVYNILKRWNGRWIATFASALLFAAVHGSLLQLTPLFIFGIVQCIAYEKARSLWLPIAIHTVFNTCSSLVILLFPEMLPI